MYVLSDRETAYICADRVPSVGCLGLQGIISTVGAIFSTQRLLVAVNNVFVCLDTLF